MVAHHPLAVDHLHRGQVEHGLRVLGTAEAQGTVARPVIVNLAGGCKEIEASAWKPGDKSTLTLQVAAHYYKLTIADEELVEIDAVNLVRKVGGVDQMAEIRAAIGV